MSLLLLEREAAANLEGVLGIMREESRLAELAELFLWRFMGVHWESAESSIMLGKPIWVWFLIKACDLESFLLGELLIFYL